ncbi:MAG TPA: exosortase family protein XrtM [Burkholderiales bacterium]|nr:exosortase family protein XrtM [Burkholderiales bacterium]
MGPTGPARAFEEAGSRGRKFRPALFLLVFAAVYTLLHFAYFALPDRLLRDQVHYYGIVLPAAEIVNLVAPREAVYAAHGALKSSNASLRIVRGCDGAGVAFLLVAAVSASAARLKYKLLGILGAALLTYALNELRVVGLYFVVAYRDGWFSPLHNYFVPIFIILAGSVFFLCWSAWAREAEARST